MARVSLHRAWPRRPRMLSVKAHRLLDRRASRRRFFRKPGQKTAGQGPHHRGRIMAGGDGRWNTRMEYPVTTEIPISEIPNTTVCCGLLRGRRLG